MSVSNAIVGNQQLYAILADTLAQAGLRQQQTEESKAQTQERLLNVLIGKQALLDQAGYRAALAGQNAPGGGDVGSPQGQVPGASSAPSAGPAPISATRDIQKDANFVMAQQLLKDKSYFQRNLSLAQQFNQDQKPWLTALDSVNTRLREASNDVSKRQTEDFKETSNIIAGIESPAQADAALRHIADTYGGDRAMEIYKTLQVNPTDGSVLWNDYNKNLFGATRNNMLSANEQAIRKQAMANAVLTNQKNAEEERHHLEEEAYKRQDLAIRREGIAATNIRAANRLTAADARLDKYLDVTGLKMESQQVKQDQQRVDKLATDYKVSDYQKGEQIAAQVQQKLADPTQGYAAVSEPEARAVVEQYKMMINNYRQRVAGKFQEDQIARMNGLLQKAEKYLTTWGSGDKIVQKDVMLNMAKEMRTLYADNNVDLLRGELGALQNSNKRGGNAAFVTTRGDLENALASGRAKRIAQNGKDYIAIPRPGLPVSPQDIYELPSTPTGRADRFRLLPPGMAGTGDAGTSGEE